MVDAFTQIVQISQQLEQLLEKRFCASGRGLHEKLTSVQDKFPSHVCSRIRRIATLRNQAVHENTDLAKEKLKEVKEAYNYVMPALTCSDDALAKINSSLTRLQQISDDLEELLTKQYGVVGHGLHAKLNNGRAKIPFSIQGKLRRIATLRSEAANKDVALAGRVIDEATSLDTSIRALLTQKAPNNRGRRNSYRREFERASRPGYRSTAPQSQKQNHSSFGYQRGAYKTQSYRSKRRYTQYGKKSAFFSKKVCNMGIAAIALSALLIWFFLFRK